MVFEEYHPEIGKLKTIGVPLHFSRKSGKIRSFPPKLGEHTKSILEDLKYSEEDIQEFLDDGIAIACDNIKSATKQMT